MRQVIENLLSILVIFLLFILFYDEIFIILSMPILFFADLLHVQISGGVEFFIQILILIMAFVIGCLLMVKIKKFILVKQFNLILLAIINTLILLGTTHALSAPFFYTESYLEDKGNELVHDYFDMFQEGLTEDEITKIAKKTLIEGEARALLFQDRPVKKLISIENEELKRKTYQYIYQVSIIERVETETGPEEHLVEYAFSIEWEKYRFLINGIQFLD